MYRGLQASNMCEVSSVGARQRTHGCSTRGLGGVFCIRPRAINVAPLGCFTGVAVQRLFQPASALLQPASVFSVLERRPGIQHDRRESAHK